VQGVPAEGSALQAAGTALAVGAWNEAHGLLLQADQNERLTDPAAIKTLAQAAYLSGSIEAATQGFERLHTAAFAAGDRDPAAAAAGQISFMLFDALIYAASRAWLRRAERFVDDRPDSPARASTATMRAWYACSRATTTRACRPRDDQLEARPSSAEWPI